MMVPSSARPSGLDRLRSVPALLADEPPAIFLRREAGAHRRQLLLGEGILPPPRSRGISMKRVGIGAALLVRRSGGISMISRNPWSAWTAKANKCVQFAGVKATPAPGAIPT